MYLWSADQLTFIMCVGTTSPLLLYLWKKNFTLSVISPKMRRQKKYWSYDWSGLDGEHWFVSMAANWSWTDLGSILSLSLCANGNKTDPKTDLRRILSLLIYPMPQLILRMTWVGPWAYWCVLMATRPIPRTDLGRNLSLMSSPRVKKWS